MWSVIYNADFVKMYTKHRIVKAYFQRICLQLIDLNYPKHKEHYLATLMSLRFCITIKTQNEEKKFRVKHERLVAFLFRRG